MMKRQFNDYGSIKSELMQLNLTLNRDLLPRATGRNLPIEGDNSASAKMAKHLLGIRLRPFCSIGGAVEIPPVLETMLDRKYCG